MPTGSISKEEAVHRALAQLGGASDEELIRFVQRESGLAVDTIFLPVYRASLRAKQFTEQARAKAREATSPSTSDVPGSQRPASESLPPESRE